MKNTKSATDATKILSILEAAAGKPVTTSAIKHRARMDYGSVSKRIFDLRARGYDILTHSHKGIDGAKATSYSF